MIPDDRLQEIILAKDADRALECVKENGSTHSEFWHTIDGAIVIYDGQSPPAWLRTVLDNVDEDGNTPKGFRTKRSDLHSGGRVSGVGINHVIIDGPGATSFPPPAAAAAMAVQRDRMRS